MMEPVTEEQINCIEVCGDGFNYGFYECDDGNKISGDGCDATCRIEKGFNCTGGTSFSADFCADIKNPVPKIELVSGDNTRIFISFDEEVTMADKVDVDSVLITIIGPAKNYDY